MGWLAIVLWGLGIWIVLFLIFRLVMAAKRRGEVSAYRSDYYGR